MRYTGPKARLCRREGVNLFGSPKYQKILARNSNIPGMHGGKRMSKLSDFGKQLREKQKAKRMFGLSEKQFKRYFTEATKSAKVTGPLFLELLERRLDNVLYRAGLAITRCQARQFASHGLFMVNGRRVDVPSIRVKVGDIIEVRPSRKGSPVFKRNKEELAHYDAPSWLKVDRSKLQVEIVAMPDETHFERIFDTQMIVEFYSR